MYGPSWAVPDPAFQFTTSDRTVRQLSGWFRGTSTHRAAWERAYSGSRGRLPTGKPSAAARKAARTLPDGGTVIDVGAGRGVDSLWLARQGFTVHAYDYVPSASQAVRQAADDEGLDLHVRLLNLNEWRTLFAEGARMARIEGPRVMIARHTADATNRFGRDVVGAVRVDVAARRWPPLPRRVRRHRQDPGQAAAGGPRRGRSHAGAAGCQNPGQQAASGTSRRGAPPRPRTIGGPMGLNQEVNQWD